MLKWWKRKDTDKEVVLKSICQGRCIPIESIPDKMFAEKMLGDGIGFVIEGDKVYAPCDGEMMLVAKTNHAVGIRAENGAEILIHVGLDTVNLQGEGITSKVKVKDKIKTGTILLELDRPSLEAKNINLTTAMIITNGSYILNKFPYKQVEPFCEVMTVIKQ